MPTVILPSDAIAVGTCAARAWSAVDGGQRVPLPLRCRTTSRPGAATATAEEEGRRRRPAATTVRGVRDRVDRRLPFQSWGPFFTWPLRHEILEGALSSVGRVAACSSANPGRPARARCTVGMGGASSARASSWSSLVVLVGLGPSSSRRRWWSRAPRRLRLGGGSSARRRSSGARAPRARRGRLLDAGSRCRRRSSNWRRAGGCSGAVLRSRGRARRARGSRAARRRWEASSSSPSGSAPVR